MLMADELRKAPLAIQIVGGQDLAVAAWTWKTFQLYPLFINRAFGIVEDGELKGSFMFREHNGINAEFSYYARDMMTPGMIRFAARFALQELCVERITIRIPRNRKRLGKKLLALGGKVEGTLRKFYGREDGAKSDAIQYVFFKEQLLRFAGSAYRLRKMN